MKNSSFPTEEHLRELMERRNRKEERERYYLLPGMGGKLFARKRRMIMVWTLLVGSLVSLVVAVILYYTHTGVRH